jgi:4-amino-4-deoxy-L-arabinose transferase-like glycosyltransferase
LFSVIIAVHLMREHRGMPISRRAAILAALFLPVAACVLLLGWYNYARFGSPTEFGINYTLQGVHPKVYQFFSLRRLPYGLLYYTVVPVNWSATFPFAHLRPELWLTPPSYLYVEPTAGLLAHSPILVILGALAWHRPQNNPHVVTLFVSLLLGFALLLLFAVTGTTMRYEVDFATFFVLPALLLWGHTLQETRSRSAVRGRWLEAAFVVLLVVSVLSNLFISFTGYYDNLKASRPQTYEALRGFFSPIERLLTGRAEIVRIEAPNGLELLNGESFFWLGGPPVTVLVHSARQQAAALTATFVPGPSVAPHLRARRVRVVVPALAWSRIISVRGGPESVHVPLMRGNTVIRIEALDAPTVLVQPNGDRRPLVVGIQGMRIGRP